MAEHPATGQGESVCMTEDRREEFRAVNRGMRLPLALPDEQSAVESSVTEVPGGMGSTGRMCLCLHSVILVALLMRLIHVLRMLKGRRKAKVVVWAEWLPNGYYLSGHLRRNQFQACSEG